MTDDKIAEIRARHEAGKTELSLQSEVIDSLNYLHSLEQLHDKDCDWQTQLTNVVWWALELVEKGEQSPSVAPKIWDAFIVGDFDTTLGIATDGARVLLAELIDDRATLLAEVERLTRDRDEARAEVERLHDDARRYRWLRDQPDLYLVTDGTKWCDPDGSDFRVSHQLSTGDSRLGVYETLDETVDHAMTLEAKL